MANVSIGSKMMHGFTPVEVVLDFSDEACYVETESGLRYRVKIAALAKPEEKPKKEK
jgi:hypothetical protein